MTEAEMLKMIRRVTGASQAAGKQEATQPDSVIAGNYARVVAEVMRRDGIELNGVDMRNIRTRVLEMLSYRRRVQMYQEKEKLRTSGRSRSGYGDKYWWEGRIKSLQPRLPRTARLPLFTSPQVRKLFFGKVCTGLIDEVYL
ncbi:hypothetical protein HMPREF0986_03828 [Escherichia coli 4_1_47FAA]|nr:hypothetical protein HMPREF0986_03828 [Escherichia coli 4_1_47FAA]